MDVEAPRKLTGGDEMTWSPELDDQRVCEPSGLLKNSMYVQGPCWPMTFIPDQTVEIKISSPGKLRVNQFRTPTCHRVCQPL